MKKYLSDPVKYRNLEPLFSVTISYENLLAENFIGIFSKNKSATNRYVYLSWLLWGFLAFEERKRRNNISVYNNIHLKKDDFVVTMNYTSFADFVFGDERVIHFHGSLNNYIIIDDYYNKEYVLDNYTNLSFSEAFSQIKKEDNQIFIPCMMPPMSIKPLISDRYLSRWVDAREKIINADELFVVGCSFSQADNHFYSIINETQAKRISIIGGKKLNKNDARYNEIRKKGAEFFSVNAMDFDFDQY